MKLEVLLSTLNLDKKKLDNQNITSKCTVINQCKENDYELYNNFKIYSFNEIGISNSRNKAIEKSTENILLFCDDDVIYNNCYDKIILKEFEKYPDADLIFFNIKSLNKNRNYKNDKKFKKIHWYNCLRYGAIRIAIKKNSLKKYNIKFNTKFGGNSDYSCGEDTLFIVDCLKNKMNLYASPELIGFVKQDNSTWFTGYNEKYFFDKGALFCAINKKYYKLLNLQYLLRHKNILTNINFFKALKIMNIGSHFYIKEKIYNDYSNSCNL